MFLTVDFSTAETITNVPPRSHTAALAGAVGGVAALIVFAVIIACIFKRRKKKSMQGFAGVTFTALSMRDRIRAEAMRALDESKVMSLFNPDDIKQLPLTSIEYVRDLGSGNFGLVFLGT